MIGLEDFMAGFVFGIIIGLILAGVLMTYFGYACWDVGYVESMKSCVVSHDWNSSACLYHKLW